MAESYTNLTEFFRFVTRQYGDEPVLSWRKSEKNKGGYFDYEDLTGNKLKELVYRLGKSIEKFGLKRGDKAAIISESRFEWVVSDFACISQGIVTVPVYTTMTSEQIRFILEHSESRLCFVSNKMLAEKLNAVYNELPKLQKIISFNKLDGEKDHVVSFEELIYDELIHEKTPYIPETAESYFREAASNTAPDDVLTIIYTSGTTGTPKGVCLTHKNILANVKQCTDSFPVLPEDKFLSFLPLAHTYERTGGYYVPLSKCSRIFYAQSIESISTQMIEVKPTLVLAVPVLFSKMRTRILKNIDSLPALRRIVAKKALKIGMKHRKNKDHYLWKLADKKVFSEIRAKTGGAVKFFISGGSALSKDVAEFFDSIGLLVLQGYGMTEASPVISVNRLEGRNCFGTVGLPLEGLEVRIAEDGEILVKGDNVMAGYYRNPKDTEEMIIDNWLHTGDIGEFDEKGFLKITDRKKSLIKTSAGKYISLTHIEDTLEASDYIDQVISFASDEKHFVSALIVPNPERLEEIAHRLGVKYNSIEELVENDSINNFFESEIDMLQKQLAKYERVRKFALLDKPFTIEGGELTPTLKLKRKVVEDKYSSLIESFYN